MADPINAARIRAAKNLRPFAEASARAIQVHVAANMEAILQTSATRGRAAGLAHLRRTVQAAEREFAASASLATRQAAAAAIESDVAAATARSLLTTIEAGAAPKAAKAKAKKLAAQAKLGRSSAVARSELAVAVGKLGKVNAVSLFKKLSGAVGRAAKAGGGTRLSKKAVEKISLNARAVVTKQAQIGSRMAINMATNHAGTMASLATRAQADALGADSYIWRTVGDDRVREEHEARDGRTYKFSKPPPDGNPGEPFNCRCSAEPVIDLTDEAELVA